MTQFRFFILAIILLGSPVSANDLNVMGLARIVDGNTLDFSGMTVRLFAIDAPDAAQQCLKDDENWSCGQEAKAFLAALAEGQKLKCQSHGTDADGAFIASCSRDGLDLGLAMIEAGLAVTTPHSPEHYLTAEAYRKTHKLGLWSSQFQHPADWRAQNVEPSAKPAEAVIKPPRPSAERVYRNKFGCAIKGNRSRRGEWIYHLPGQPYYDQTRPEELFCTETEAQRAGYRRSKA